MRVALLVLLALLATGCPGGDYARKGGMVHGAGQGRGSTNGRSFDFISTKPDGSEWTLRLRGPSLWVAYSEGARTDDLGAVKLSQGQRQRAWELIEAVGLIDRPQGMPDPVAGTVLLRLREPAGKAHEIIVLYEPRDTDDPAILDLAEYFAALVEQTRGERPGF